MARRNQPHVPKPAFPEYRIRFKTHGAASKILGSDVATAHPGIIKRNRPRAEQYLAALPPDWDKWIEVRDSEDSDWRRID